MGGVCSYFRETPVQARLTIERPGWGQTLGFEGLQLGADLVSGLGFRVEKLGFRV